MFEPSSKNKPERENTSFYQLDVCPACSNHDAFKVNPILYICIQQLLDQMPQIVDTNYET